MKILHDPPSITVGPVPNDLRLGSEMSHYTRPGLFRSDGNLQLGKLVGQEHGYQALTDAVTAAQAYSGGDKPAVLVRALEGVFYLNESGYWFNGSSDARPGYYAKSLPDMRVGDSIAKLHPSLEAVVDGDLRVLFGDKPTITL